MERLTYLFERLESALKQRFLSEAARLFGEVGEEASRQGWLGDLTLLFRNDPRRFFDPAATIKSVSSMSIVMEHNRHEQQAQQLLDYLIRFSETCGQDDERLVEIWRECLILQVQSGSYRTGRVMAEYLVTLTTRTATEHEKLAMCNNCGAIHHRLGDDQGARKWYTKALSDAWIYSKQSRENDEYCSQVNRAAKRNLDGLMTGYDPDFVFFVRKAGGSGD